MDEKITELEKKVKLLIEEIKILKNKRILQSDILPDVIKTRHMGEGNRYMYSGLAANKPEGTNEIPNSMSIYFATDTNTLYIYNGTAWVSSVLS